MLTVYGDWRRVRTRERGVRPRFGRVCGNGRIAGIQLGDMRLGDAGGGKVWRGHFGVGRILRSILVGLGIAELVRLSSAVLAVVGFFIALGFV